jgi:hypothetical protein
MVRRESSLGLSYYRKTHKLYKRSINYNIKKSRRKIRGLEKQLVNLSTSE